MRKHASQRWQLLLALIATVFLFRVSSSTFAQAGVGTKARDEESEAVKVVRAVRRAESAYAKRHGGDYATFQQLVAVKALDKRFVYEAPRINGYVFRLVVMPKGVNDGYACFRLNADPYVDVRGGRLRRHFYVDCESGAVHVSAEGIAAADDPVL